MKSARIVKPKESLEVQQLETPKPRVLRFLLKFIRQVYVIAISTYGKEDMRVRMDNF
jgi:hypothetical protein